MPSSVPRKNCSVNSRHGNCPQLQSRQKIDYSWFPDILNATRSDQHKFGGKHGSPKVPVR
jgi:hypothetical protein